MSDLNREPTFNLKAVVKETGVKPDTIRAWERRYGLPQPERSEGGHRIFSQRDIDTLKWLTQRQAEGLSISRAVDLWQSLVSEGKDPLVAMPQGLTPPRDTLPVLSGMEIERARELWVEACLKFSSSQAENILNQAFAQFPTATVVLEVLIKGLSDIGEGWFRGEYSVQQEHFATELAHRRIESLLSASPPPVRNAVILVACAPEEEHSIAPLTLSYLLRRFGFQVTYLGANVPFSEFSEAVEHIKPNLVVMTAQRLHSAAKLIPFAQLMIDQGIPFGYGGRAFNELPELRDRFPGHWLGPKLAEAPEAIQAVLEGPTGDHKTTTTGPVYPELEEAFEGNMDSLKATLKGDQPSLEPTGEFLDIANEHLTADLLAALKLGDLNLIQPDLQWISLLLRNRGLPDKALNSYLRAYQRALREVLQDRADPLIEVLNLQPENPSG